MRSGYTRDRLALLALLLLGTALRAWGLDAQSLWRDEVDTVRFATQPLPDLLSMFVVPGHNGPLYYLLMRPWIGLTGRSDYALRYSALLLGILTLPLAYQVTRRWAGPRPALLATLLLTVSPYAIWYSQETRMYTLLLCLILLATWFWIEALWRGNRLAWVPYVLTISAGIYVHYLFALVIPTHVLLSFLTPRALRRGWLPWLLAYAFFAVPYIPLAWWQKTLLFSPTFRTGHPFVPWPEMIRRLLIAFSVGVHTIRIPHPVPQVVRVVPLLFLTLSGTFLPQRLHPTRRAGLALWFLLPVLGLYLISLELPLFTERYLIWTMPAVYTLVAAGVWVLVRWQREVTLASLALTLTLFLVGIGYQWAYPIKPDMRAAAAYVEAHRQPGEVVLFHLGYLVHAYGHYAPRSRDAWREAPAPGPEGTPEGVGRELRARLNGACDLWLVESESAMWDPKGLVRQWLDEHGETMEKRSFVGVEVVHYRLCD